ncbi:MAG: carbohydrate porin [Cyclobacteriaceae bacterium]
MKKLLVLAFTLLSYGILSNLSYAQIMYQEVTNKKFGIGAYGRVGVDWNFEDGGSIGRRLNLNNMGSIGGRMEEQDYLELATALNFMPFKKRDSTIIYFQMRLSVFSRSLSLFGNSTTSTLGGLTIGMPEFYVAAKNINGKPISAWIGARLYRGEDVHIADHFYFNDHSGQGFGIEYKKTRFNAILVSSTDTSSTVPPYFYLNIKTGTPSLSLRGRWVYALEHDIQLKKNNQLTLLGEYHRLQDASEEDVPDSLDFLNYPADFGWVLGFRLNTQIPNMLEGSYNNLAVRYGARIANGGDGGLSRTYLTFGAPNLETESFGKAYSWAIVNNTLLNFSDKVSLQSYFIYTNSKGAASSNDMAPTYFGREIYNKKEDFTVGGRLTNFITDKFHFLSELHYSQRRDGTEPLYTTVKVGIYPSFVPTGERNVWARPHLRFDFSLAWYNDYAMENLYSPYLEFMGEARWGYYFGVKAEWWIWN